MEKIKPCPFCGKQPDIIPTVQANNRFASKILKHDIEIHWEIKCEECDIGFRSVDPTFYAVTNDETLIKMPQSYRSDYDGSSDDQKQIIIDKWNARM